MKPETARYFERAQVFLSHARIIFGVQLFAEAGRTAYLAGFHAAQALIMEMTGRVVKTHNGVRTEFLRLVRDDQTIDPSIRAFLPRGYNLKSASDYGIGAEAEVSAERALEALEAAKIFVAWTEFKVMSLNGADEPAQ